MGLFVRRSDSGTHAPLYTLGQNKTVLIVGLGNVGKEYEKTRHNIGFAVLDIFAKQQGFPGWVEKKDLKCLFTKQLVGDTDVILIKPTTYMNESGQAAQATQSFYKIVNSQTLVVHDELDMPFGQVRARVGGSDAGNNGIKSLIAHLGEDFARIRIGINNELAQTADGANFVLSKFSSEEQHQLDKLINESQSLLNEFIATGELPHDTRKIL